MNRTINLVLQNRDPTQVKLKDVLICTDLSSALRSENKLLFQYLFPNNREKTELKELIDWALTTKNNTSKDDFIYNRNAATVLSNSSSKFHKALLEDGTIEKSLVAFFDPSNELIKSPEFAGQFSRICAQFSRQTQFSFFKSHPCFYKKILDNADLLSYQRLFVDMFTENLDAFCGNDRDGLVKYFTQKFLNTKLLDGHFQILHDLATESNEEDIQVLTDNDKFMSRLIQATQCIDSLSLLINMTSTIDLLFDYITPQKKNELLRKAKPPDFENLCRKDILKAYALFPLFWRQGLPVMTKYFFQTNGDTIPNSIFCQSYVKVFKSMSLKDRIKYFEELNLLDLIHNSIFASPNYENMQFNICIFHLVKAIAKPPKTVDETEMVDTKVTHPFNCELWSSIVFYVMNFFDDFKVCKFNKLGYESIKKNDGF